MDTLILNLALIRAASLAGRRWGESVSGWLPGLPLTSGPVCLFLALEQGPRIRAASTLGSLARGGRGGGLLLRHRRPRWRCCGAVRSLRR